MTDKSETSFAVVRFNERTYQSGGVVAVIKVMEAAQRTLNDFDWCQSEEHPREGWRYFLEETNLQPGMDPEKATTLRQVRLDLQETEPSCGHDKTLRTLPMTIIGISNRRRSG
jgi:hypothetical protein